MPGATKGKPRPTYTDAQKQAVLDRLTAGETAKAIAEDTGINPVTIGNWKREAGVSTGRGKKASSSMSSANLNQAEIAKIDKLIDMLKAKRKKLMKHTEKDIYSEIESMLAD